MRPFQQSHEPDTQEDQPVGTWVLLCLIAIVMTAGWLFLYYGVFLPRGTVH